MSHGNQEMGGWELNRKVLTAPTDLTTVWMGRLSVLRDGVEEK